MAHFGIILLTSIVTHGNSDKIPQDKSCHYWRAYLYSLDNSTLVDLRPLQNERARQRESLPRRLHIDLCGIHVSPPLQRRRGTDENFPPAE